MCIAKGVVAAVSRAKTAADWNWVPIGIAEVLPVETTEQPDFIPYCLVDALQGLGDKEGIWEIHVREIVVDAGDIGKRHIGCVFFGDLCGSGVQLTRRNDVARVLYPCSWILDADSTSGSRGSLASRGGRASGRACVQKGREITVSHGRGHYC